MVPTMHRAPAASPGWAWEGQDFLISCMAALGGRAGPAAGSFTAVLPSDEAAATELPEARGGSQKWV